MNEQERIEVTEQAMYQSWRVSCALRSVAFLLSQTDGKGPSSWYGEPLEDLATLIGVLADKGVDHADAGLEGLRGILLDRTKTA
ncbi:MAG: hypothetical protein WCK63_17635 [Betaproteobacteria bacterium]